MYGLRRIACGILAGVSFAVTAIVATAAPMPPEPSPVADRALVYIFYPWSTAGVLQGAAFFIDDKKVVAMGMGGCTRILAPAGKHEFAEGQQLPVMLPLSRPELKATVNWEPGRRYFYRYGPGRVGLFNVMAITRLEEAEGQEVALKCRYVAPQMLDTDKPAAGGK